MSHWVKKEYESAVDTRFTKINWIHFIQLTIWACFFANFCDFFDFFPGTKNGTKPVSYDFLFNWNVPTIVNVPKCQNGT